MLVVTFVIALRTVKARFLAANHFGVIVSSASSVEMFVALFAEVLYVCLTNSTFFGSSINVDGDAFIYGVFASNAIQLYRTRRI